MLRVVGELGEWAAVVETLNYLLRAFQGSPRPSKRSSPASCWRPATGEMDELLGESAAAAAAQDEISYV